MKVGKVKPTLLVIDDMPDNLTLAYKLLKDDYKVKGANNGRTAILIAENDLPDLILLDVMMPEMDGFAICRHLKSNPKTESIPIIFFTARTESIEQQKGLELGAVDYILKPIDPNIIKRKIKNHLDQKFKTDLLRAENDSLEREVERRIDENVKQVEQLNAIQDVALNAMISLAETRDTDMGNHIRRTQLYINILADKLKSNKLYSSQLDSKSIELIVKSAPLHDIGKIGIPDTILMKRGPLSGEEFNIMKEHTTLGFRAIENVELASGRAMGFLRYAKEIVLYHHERWDGKGYPKGLSKDDIPLSARLMAVADVYDALINKRIYKPALSREEARCLIIKGKGTQFDPHIVNAFIEAENEIYNIALRYANSDGHLILKEAEDIDNIVELKNYQYV